MLATVISDILFRMGKRRERMRTGRVVASLVSGHPPFAPFEFVMDAITYIPLASASCSGSKWGAMDGGLVGLGEIYRNLSVFESVIGRFTKERTLD